MLSVRYTVRLDFTMLTNLTNRLFEVAARGAANCIRLPVVQSGAMSRVNKSRTDTLINDLNQDVYS